MSLLNNDLIRNLIDKVDILAALVERIQTKEDRPVVGGGDVVGPGSAVSGDLASYSGTTGKIIADSGILASNVAQGPASAGANGIAAFNGTTGKLLKDSGINYFNVVQGPASSVSDNLASYNGTGGKNIKDSGILASNVVQGPASSTDNDIALFSGIGGKLIKDSTLQIAESGATAHVLQTASSGDATITGVLTATKGIQASGSSFPASPAAGQQFFRSDIGHLCFYDGSRWLTAHEYAAPADVFSTGGTATQFVSRIRTQYLPYVTRISLSSQVLTLSNGTNYYTVTIRGVNVAYNSAVNIHIFNTSADAAGSLIDKDSAPNQTATPNPGAIFDYSIVKTGSPGTLNLYGAFYYRFIIP